MVSPLQGGDGKRRNEEVNVSQLLIESGVWDRATLKNFPSEEKERSRLEETEER